MRVVFLVQGLLVALKAERVSLGFHLRGTEIAPAKQKSQESAPKGSMNTC